MNKSQQFIVKVLIIFLISVGYFGLLYNKFILYINNDAYPEYFVWVLGIIAWLAGSMFLLSSKVEIKSND